MLRLTHLARNLHPVLHPPPLPSRSADSPARPFLKLDQHLDQPQILLPDRQLDRIPLVHTWVRSPPQEVPCQLDRAGVLKDGRTEREALVRRGIRGVVEEEMVEERD